MMEFIGLKSHVRYCELISTQAAFRKLAEILLSALFTASLVAFFDGRKAPEMRFDGHRRVFLQRGFIATFMVVVLLTIAALSILGALAMVQASLQIATESLS